MVGLVNILKSAINKSKYLKDTYSEEISLYNLEDTAFNKVYEKNSIVVIKDPEGLELESVNDKQKYMFMLESAIEKNKSISILVCKDENELNNIFTYNKDLKNKYFVFNLVEERQEKSVLYNEILEATNIDEELKIKLLDYVTATYDKSEQDSETYRDNLINYILLNNDVPVIKEEKTMDLRSF